MPEAQRIEAMMSYASSGFSPSVFEEHVEVREVPTQEPPVHVLREYVRRIGGTSDFA